MVVFRRKFDQSEAERNFGEV